MFYHKLGSIDFCNSFLKPTYIYLQQVAIISFMGSSKLFQCSMGGHVRAGSHTQRVCILLANLCSNPSLIDVNKLKRCFSSKVSPQKMSFSSISRLELR